jgi:hypothetical protein
MYEKQIEQLIVLQYLDEEIVELELEKERAPKELDELESRKAGIDEQMTQIQEKLDMLHEQKKRLSGEIEDDTLKIRRSKNKLMMATNTREYQAMMREMDNLEKLNRLREEESVTLSEEVARQEQVLEEIKLDAAKVAAELEEKRAGIDERLAEIQKRLDELQARRAIACEAIPKPILSRYEFIRSRLRTPVIVPVDVGVCHGCNIAIPPQTYNELQRGKQIHSCPNCQRLIFWQQHAPAEAEGKQDKAKAEAEEAVEE